MSSWSNAVWGFGHWGYLAPAPGLCWVGLSFLALATVCQQLKSHLEVTVMPNSLLPGNVLTLTLYFEQGGAFRDPNTVSLRLKKPDGTELSPPPTPIRISTGKWAYDFDTDGQPVGVWTYRAEGDGLVDAAVEGTFTVQQSAFS